MRNVATPTAADLRAAQQYGRLVDPIAAQYTNPVTGKPLSGTALLLKVASGESGFDSSANSGKAQGRTQFTPGSRAEVLRITGGKVDPLRSTDEAYHATALHLLGKVNGKTGLAGYNPGMPSYTSYILGQKVGATGASSTGGSASVSGGEAAPVGGVPDAQNSAAVQALLGALQTPRQARPSAGLQTPGFAAQAALPAGYASPVSAGGPDRSSGIDALLRAAAQSGQGTAGPTATAAQAGPQGPAAPSGPGQVMAAGYPTGKPGKIIGTPHAGTHTLGNWQSDNAIDIAVPIGTPMLALDTGVVVKVTRHPQGSGRFAGDQITVRGTHGNEYFYAHGTSSVKAGQKVQAGEVIGTTGSANGVEHLHLGIEHGDPRKIVGQGR